MHERILNLVMVALLIAGAMFAAYAMADHAKRLCKYNEYGYVRDGYHDGRYAGRCDDFGRLVR